MITCPYCGEKFSKSYYDNTHVPCPEPRGDKEKVPTKAEIIDYAIEKAQALRAQLNAPMNAD